MIARRILAPAIALALTALPSAAAVNPQGIAASTCPRCSASDGTATGSCSQVNASFEWSINLGLARYPKPATYAGIGATAYERDGSLPTFGELIGRYFPSTPLQQIQIPLRISQTRISLATFHPSCLILDSEALFERIPQSDAGGAFLHQIVTDDAITQIDLLSGGRPAGYPEGTNCGPGWQIRVWKRPTSLGDKDEDDYYVTTSLGTPLTNAVICRPQGKTTNDNDTLLFILMETTGAQSEDSRTTTQIIAQTLGTSTQSYSYDRPVGVVSSLYAGVVTTDPGSTGGAPLSRETLVYGDHGAKKWDYTITRTVQVQPSPLPAPYGSTTLITTAESEEDYDDYSPASGGGEPGMKRLMSFESSGRTTEYEYFSEPTVPSTHGRPKSVTRPDGSWTAWEYIVDTVSIFTEYSSWPDVAIEDKATARKTVTTVSGSGFTVESYVAGQPVAKSWTVISGQTVTDSQWDATASEWHDTVTVYFPDGCSDPPLAAGRVSSVTRPDGTRTTYTYGGSATNQIVTEVADSASSPAGSAGPDALKTITHYNSGNIAIQQDVYIVAAGSADRPILTESWQAYAPAGFDALGRPVRRDFADGTTEITRYACCGLKNQTSRDGAETEYFRDALKRVYKVTVDPAGPAPLAATETVTASSAWTSVIASGITTTRELTVGETTVFLGSTTASLDGLASLSVEPSRKSSDAADRLHTLTQTASDGLTTTVYHKRQGDGSWITDSVTTRYADGQTSTFTGPDGTDAVTYTYGTHSENGGGLCSTTSSGGLTASTYTDSLGRNFRTTAPASGETNYTYCESTDPAGSLGKLKTVTDADSVTTTYGYNVRGERTTTTRTVPVGTSYTPTALISTTTTGSIGNAPTIHGDQNLNICSYQKQEAGSLVLSETYATLDGLKTATVTPAGNTLSVRTRASSSNSWTETVLTTHPDGTMTRTTSTPSTSGRTVATARFAKGANPSSGTPVSSTASVYDNFGRLTSTNEWRTGDTTYSGHTESGQATSVSEPGNNRTTAYEYDILGRTIKVDAPNTTNPTRDNITRTSYWPTGRVKAVWGDLTYPTVTIYDGQGRISELRTFRKWPHTTDATGPDEDTANSLTVTVDATTWIYSAATGLLVEKNHPGESDDGTTDKDFTYTAAGRLQVRTSERGITTTYGYLHGVLTSVTYANEPTGQPATPDLTYTYDFMGRLDTVSRGSAPHAQYHYTGLKLTSEDLNQDTDCPLTITRTYENMPGGLPGYRPDGYSFIEDATTYSANWAFDTAGRPSSVTDGNDTFTYGYKSQSHGLVETVGSDLHWVYNEWRSDRDIIDYKWTGNSDWGADAYYETNSLGQRESFSIYQWALDSEGMYFDLLSFSQSSLGYDSFGQLTALTDWLNTDSDRTYSYDSIGNRLTATADNGTTSYWGDSDADQPGANPLNQYVKTTFPSAPSVPVPSVHDLDGNMTSGPLGGSACTSVGVPAPTAFGLVWDAENRLIEATAGTNTVTYEYDHLSRLIRRYDGETATHYLYDGWNRIAEYTQTTSTPELSKVFLWGLDLSGSLQGAGGVGGLLSIFDTGAEACYYPAFDGNGNVIAYLDSLGDPVARFEYDPFGNLTGLWELSSGLAATFPFRFSTKPIDPVTGLYYYGYRWYDPLTGRWPTRDPIGEIGGINLYGFVGNDAVNSWDLFGFCADGECKVSITSWNDVSLRLTINRDANDPIELDSPELGGVFDPDMNLGDLEVRDFVPGKIVRKLLQKIVVKEVGNAVIKGVGRALVMPGQKVLALTFNSLSLSLRYDAKYNICRCRGGKWQKWENWWFMSEIENRRWTLSTVDADGNIGSSAIEPLTPDNLVKAIESAIQAASLNGITEFTKSQIAEKEKCTLVN